MTTDERSPGDCVGDALPDAETALAWMTQRHGDELTAATALLEAAWCAMANHTGAQPTADYLQHTATRIHQIDAGASFVEH